MAASSRDQDMSAITLARQIEVGVIRQGQKTVSLSVGRRIVDLQCVFVGSAGSVNTTFAERFPPGKSFFFQYPHSNRSSPGFAALGSDLPPRASPPPPHNLIVIPQFAIEACFSRCSSEACSLFRQLRISARNAVPRIALPSRQK